MFTELPSSLGGILGCSMNTTPRKASNQSPWCKKKKQQQHYISYSHQRMWGKMPRFRHIFAALPCSEKVWHLNSSIARGDGSRCRGIAREGRAINMSNRTAGPNCALVIQSTPVCQATKARVRVASAINKEKCHL